MSSRPRKSRLPNVKELSSIADKTKSNPATDGTAFPATVSFWYWTSSPYVGYANSAWGVDFYSGYVSYGSRSDFNHVRLVR